MKNSLKNIFFMFVLGSLVLSCKKKEEPPPPPEPELEFVSVSATSVKQYEDSIVVTLKYKDVNGDLGDLSPDELSLRVKDGRLQNSDGYHVKPLAPVLEENIPIEGDLKVKLSSLFLLGTGNTEVTTLKIKIKDRAGNWSNEVSTPQIVINK